MHESEVTPSCPTLSHPVDCSLPGSSVHGIFQARVLEWVAISFSKLSIEWHIFLFVNVYWKLGLQDLLQKWVDTFPATVMSAHPHTSIQLFQQKAWWKSQKTAQWRKRSSGRNRGQLHNIGNWKKKIIISEFLKLTKTWKSLSTISLCPHVCFWQFWLPGHLTSKQIMAYFVLFCHTA